MPLICYAQCPSKPRDKFGRVDVKCARPGSDALSYRFSNVEISVLAEVPGTVLSVVEMSVFSDIADHTKLVAAIISKECVALIGQLAKGLSENGTRAGLSLRGRAASKLEVGYS